MPGVVLGSDKVDASGKAVASDKCCIFVLPVSYTHLRAHETVLDLVCRLLLEKKKRHTTKYTIMVSDQQDTNSCEHQHEVQIVTIINQHEYVTDT